ncbi:hypothetical protein [Natronospora cellulosivora (SeqCode)]
MKNKFASITILVLLSLLLSITAFADHDYIDMDLDWGEAWDDGSYWGISFYEGNINSYFHIQEDRRANRRIIGPYLYGEDVQEVTTTIGNALGVRYSDYVASFVNDQVLGLRVAGYELASQYANFTFDGTYVLGFQNWRNNHFHHSPGMEFIADRGDIALNAEGNIDRLNLNTALLRYTTGSDDDPDEDYESFINYAIEADIEIIDDLVLDAVYAAYQENDDFLYQITADYQVLDNLSVRLGHRNSEFAYSNDDIRDYSPLRGPGNRYLRGATTWGPFQDIWNIWNMDENYRAGFTYDFNPATFYRTPILNFENSLSVDYSTSNPYKRYDLKDQLEVTLRTDYDGFIFEQKAFTLFSDKEVEADRFFYGLGFESPEYSVDLGEELNDLSVTALLNYDYTINYDPLETGEYLYDARKHYLTTGVKLNTTQDIWRLWNLELGAIIFADMPHEYLFDGETDLDLIKYIINLKYTAPNGIQFRAQYFSSEDYARDNINAVNNDRYAPYRWYNNDTVPGGVRMAIGIPF